MRISDWSSDVCSSDLQTEVAGLPPHTSPLLQVHGCRQKDHDHMVWAPGQITAPPVADRLASSAQWMPKRLLDRALLIVGYWTDWAYLNQLFCSVLEQDHPHKVTDVDIVERPSNHYTP